MGMVYYTLVMDKKTEKMIDSGKFMGVSLDVWIDLQAEIEIRGYTVYEYMTLLRDGRITWEPARRFGPSHYFDEWNW